MVRTPPLCPLGADPWGPRSSRNGRPQPQWPPQRAQLGSPPPPCQEPTPAETGPPLHAARVRPAPAPLPAGSQPQWRPQGAQLRPTPNPQRSESPHAQPGFTPARVRSRRVSSRSGHLREHNWEGLPHPRQEPTTAPRHPGSPRPCRAPVAFPAAVGTPENTTETAPHPLPTGTPTHAARVRPTPGAARCSPSPGAPGEPRPHARFQERLWLLPPVQTRGQYIHPTGTIQAVYDLGIKRGLQKGKVT